MPPSWRFESLQHVTTALEDCEELSAEWVRSPRDLAGDSAVNTVDETIAPPGYECQRVWDWDAGGFRRPDDSRTSDDVRIEYLTRTNGPDVYVVKVGGVPFATRSRSWALLHGFRRANRKAFATVGSSVLVRSGDDGPHIPLPIARAIALRAGIVGGPGRSAQLGRFYAYGLGNTGLQQWLLSWLNGGKTADASQRRLAWLREAMSTRSADAVRIPADLRRRLRELRAGPDALAIAEGRIPRHLLAHVRRAVKLAET
jgi:hypothetical protein